MTVHRPGDVLAGRYRLADLLSETDHGRFWLAHDSILGRPVAVHVIDADDPRAPGLMRAARASASIADQRLLRVLDAETREGISYVVNEWGRGSSLDIVLARSGPLSPERAAWITAQVAATLAKAHDLGYFHGRLNPENILIDEAGSVRVIGFAVEAALYGLPEGSAAEDDAALASILAACLTGTWSGATESSVPPTPMEGGHPMRPRQVRAGIPRLLDDLCDAALNPQAHGRHEGPVVDARYLHDRLMEFVGEPPDLSELPAERSRLAPQAPTHPPGEQTSPDPLDDATQAALPSFEDDDSWHRPRDVPAPPPPQLHPPEPKPLFADEPRAGQAPEAVPPQRTAGDDYWPWQHEGDATAVAPAVGPAAVPPVLAEVEDERRSRWLPAALGFVALLVVLAAVLIVHQATRNDTNGAGGNNATQTATPATPIRGITATDFDPYGDPQSENPDEVGNVVDGKPDTAWHTSTYTDQLGPEPPALKSGVGVILDLHGSHTLSSATLSVLGGATDVTLYVTDTKPTTTTGLKAAAHATVGGSDQRIPLHDAQGRYVVVWLTSLPHVDGGYRGALAEATVAATR